MNSQSGVKLAGSSWWEKNCKRIRPQQTQSSGSTARTDAGWARGGALAFRAGSAVDGDAADDGNTCMDEDEAEAGTARAGDPSANTPPRDAVVDTAAGAELVALADGTLAAAAPTAAAAATGDDPGFVQTYM